MLILLSNSFTIRRDKSLLYNRTVIVSLVYSSCFVYNSFGVTFFGANGIGIYGGLFFISPVTLAFHFIIYILTCIILIFTAFYPTICSPDKSNGLNYLNVKIDSITKYLKSSENKDNGNNLLVNRSPDFSYVSGDTENWEQKQDLQLNQPQLNDTLNFRSEIYNILEYPLIILFVVNGALFLMCSLDLMSIFISIELQSYGLYIISTIYKHSEQSTSGGLMYFLLGGLSSCFILLGAGLLYANSGTTNLDNLYIINDISNVSTLFFSTQAHMENAYNTVTYTGYYIITSLIFIAVGLLFKVSAAPFHFWSPDVYDSIPTVVTTFVAIIAKISIFILLLEISSHFMAVSPTISVLKTEQYIVDYFYYPILSNNLLVSSILSLVIGSILGLSQTRIKKLFAYSTISHIGFILLGLSINSVESIQAFLFYLIQYSFTNLNAFLLLVCLGYTYHYYVNKQYENLKDKINSPIQLINQVKGYLNINPILCLSLCITLFSFTGIPPLVGFFGKMMILSAAIDKGYLFMCLLAILTSVISAGYYLYIIKQMYFYPNETNYIQDLTGREIKSPNYEFGGAQFKQGEKQNNIMLSDYLTISLSIITLSISLFITSANECLNITCILALMFF